MKTITINVSEPTYQAFQSYAKRIDRKASELIREAMEEYRVAHIQPARRSLLDIVPFESGGTVLPIGPDDDILGEMLDEARS
jgi:hypothetical protein